MDAIVDVAMTAGHFTLGDWVVDPGLCRLVRQGQSVHLRSKSMAVLIRLAARAGGLVTRDELIEDVWAGQAIAEEGLTHCIGEIRDALGDDPHRPAFLETVPKRGYRLVAPVVWASDAPDPAPLHASDHPGRTLPPSVIAADCYQRARGAIDRFTGEGVVRAIDLLEEGLEVVGPNALLYAGLGYAHFQRAHLGPQRDDDFGRADAYARVALRLDPGLSQAQLVLGLVEMAFHANQAESVRRFRRALSLDPQDPDALWWLTIVYGCYVGKGALALDLARRLADIDSRGPLSAAVEGLVHFFEGRFARSVEIFERTLGKPELPIARGWLATGLFYAGRMEEALALIEPVELTSGCDSWTSLMVLLRHAIRRTPERMGDVLTPAFLPLAQRRPNVAWQLASLFAWLDAREQALEWLECAIERGFVNYPFMSGLDPFLAGLGREPRFQRLMERALHSWETFGD